MWEVLSNEPKSKEDSKNPPVDVIGDRFKVFYIYIYLTTTSSRPEPECTLRRVMSSEPIQDE